MTQIERLTDSYQKLTYECAARLANHPIVSVALILILMCMCVLSFVVIMLYSVMIVQFIISINIGISAEDVVNALLYWITTTPLVGTLILVITYILWCIMGKMR
jgi:hypothetical protein